MRETFFTYNSPPAINESVADKIITKQHEKLIFWYTNVELPSTIERTDNGGPRDPKDPQEVARGSARNSDT